ARAADRLARWGGHWLKEEKRQLLLASATRSVGGRTGEGERRRIRVYAGQAVQGRRQVRPAQRQVRRLVRERAELQGAGRAAGGATGCGVWVHGGDARQYSSGAAYRKAMGLNLTERSSGIYRGQLKISKRGPGQVRRWLYLAAVRLVRRCGLREWYQAQK